MVCCTKLVLGFSLSGLGVVLVALGAGLGWGFFPAFVENAIGEAVALVEGSDAWDMWVQIPLLINFKVYLFNVTNPDEVHAGATPILQEKGPYVYLSNKTKKQVTVSEDQTKASYFQFTHLDFSQELSGELREDDVIYTLNAALMGAVLEGDRLDDTTSLSVIDGAASFAFKDSDTVFAQGSVGDILFGGLRIYCDEATVTRPQWFAFCQGLGAEVDDNDSLRPAENGDFLYSYFYSMQDNHDGYYQINTGVEDWRMLGWIHEWENSSTLSNWGGPECNQIRGTDASIFPPFRTRKSRIDIFSTDLCRSLYATYLEDMELKDIKGYRYVASEDQLATVEDNPDNYCYCAPNSACVKEGSLDLQTCVNGAVVLTFPHFYQSSPDYLASVQGLQPEQEKHQTYLDIEPNTGVILSAGKRVQFNMMVKPVSGVRITERLPLALVPLLWIDEGVDLDDENAALLRSELNNLVVLEGIKWGIIALGLVLALGGCVLVIQAKVAARKRS